MDRRSFLLHTSIAALGGALGCARGRPGAHPARPAPPAIERIPAEPSARRPARSIVLLYMAGGPSQIDTFDPKPGTDNARGRGAIATPVDGLEVSDLLPRLAAKAQSLAILRSLQSREGNHARGRYLMHTGYPPGAASHPSFGSIVSSVKGHATLPAYVSIAGPGAPAGFLGPGHGPFVVAPSGRVRNLEPFRGDHPRADHRRQLAAELDEAFAAGRGSAVVEGHRELRHRAVELMRSKEIAAFDAEETEAVLGRYGGHTFGKSCLIARRLVEVGVPFVEVSMNGWDTHKGHDARIVKLCEALDQGMSALLGDLEERGLLDETLVLWTGDFGRTPRFNEIRGGRDHYPRATPVVLAGGGIRGGQVVGATDEHGEALDEGALSTADLFRTIAEATGVDPDKKRLTPEGRPIATVDGGRVIPGLLG